MCNITVLHPRTATSSVNTYQTPFRVIWCWEMLNTEFLLAFSAVCARRKSAGRVVVLPGASAKHGRCSAWPPLVLNISVKKSLIPEWGSEIILQILYRFFFIYLFFFNPVRKIENVLSRWIVTFNNLPLNTCEDAYIYTHLAQREFHIPFIWFIVFQ